MAAIADAPLFAIVLAGGSSSRLHATTPQPTVDKPLLVLDGKPVLGNITEAIQRHMTPERIVVVGPDSLPTGQIATVYEDPPGSGPYMGVRAGLQHLSKQFGPATDAEAVLLLGADMPYIGLGIEQLFEHHHSPAEVVITRAAGRLQPLLSYIPRRIADSLFAEPVIDAGLMKTLGKFPHQVVDVSELAVTDLDTYQDAIDAGIRF